MGLNGVSFTGEEGQGHDASSRATLERSCDLNPGLLNLSVQCRIQYNSRLHNKSVKEQIGRMFWTCKSRLPVWITNPQMLTYKKDDTSDNLQITGKGIKSHQGMIHTYP